MMLEEYIGVAVVILFILLCIGFIVQSWLYIVFISRLKKEHKDVWEWLGKPRLFSACSSGEMHAVSYIKQGKFIDLDDDSLVRVGRLIRVLSPVYMGVFILLSIAFVLFILLGR